MGDNSPVLVTGATGFVGRTIIHELLRRRIPACALVRSIGSASSQSLACLPGVVLRQGDVTAPESLERALQDVTRVIHLVGIISEAGSSTFENIHTRGTENLVRAAASAGVKRFIHMSALGTRPDAVSRYHQTKWAAEQVVGSSSMEWTIFRPSLIYGPGDHFLTLFSNITRFSPVLPVPGTGRSRFAPVHVSQVASAFVTALDQPRAARQILDLCGPERFTLPEMLRETMRATGRKRAILRIPLPVACFQAAVLGLLYGRLLHKPPPLNRGQLIMLEEDNLGDGSQADELFDLKHPLFGDAVRSYVS